MTDDIWADVARVFAESVPADASHDDLPALQPFTEDPEVVHAMILRKTDEVDAKSHP